MGPQDFRMHLSENGSKKKTKNESLRMSLFEALYGRNCNTPISWSDSVGSVKILGRCTESTSLKSLSDK